jgi:hypothetical protein
MNRLALLSFAGLLPLSAYGQLGLPAGIAQSYSATSSPTPCPFGSAGYADGCGTAPAGTIIFPSALAGYTARPPWDVAGFDYAVGPITGTTYLDPSTISVSGVTVNASAHTVTISGNNITLSAIDFGMDSGWQVIVNGSNDALVNDKFTVGANQGALANVLTVNTSATNFTMTSNEFNGANIGPTPQVGQTISISASGTVTVEYNYFVACGGDVIDFNANNTAMVPIVKWNLNKDYGGVAAHADFLQWYGANTNAGGQINFDTVYQTINQPAGGNGMMVTLSEGPMNMAGLDVSNPTIITLAACSTCNFGAGFYADDSGTAQYVSYRNAFIDPTGINEYTGSPQFPTGFYGTDLAVPAIQQNMTDMVNGGSLAPYTASSPGPGGYYTNPDGSGETAASGDTFSFSANPPTGTIAAGQTITITMNLAQVPWTVTGSPTLSLNSGGIANYVSGSGTDAIVFRYVVGATDSANPLTVTAINP